MPSVNTEDALCCCEYINAQGEQSHLLGCCCDCQALDQACDNCITCQRIPDHTCDNMWRTVQDRLRIPWTSGKGAVQLRLDLVLPILLVPLTLLLATLCPTMTVVMLVFMVTVMFLYYRSWTRKSKNKRTKLFYVFSITSVALLYYTFELVVIGYREILLWENLLLSTIFGVLMNLLYIMRKQPGLLKTSPKTTDFNSEQNSHYKSLEMSYGFVVSGDENKASLMEEQNGQSESAAESIPEQNVHWLDSRPFKGGQLDTWCSICQVKKTPRSGHCPVCNVCVSSRDHHCVWIDNCIGEKNHRTFLFGCVMFIFCGCYGAQLTLTTICTPEMYFDWFLFPKDCRFVYSDFFTAWAYVCSCYTLLACGIMALVTAHQLVLISQNVTTQEMHMAARRGLLRCWLFAKNNVNNEGVLKNWWDFLNQKRKQSYGSVTV